MTATIAPTVRSVRAIGTTAVIAVTSPHAADDAERILRRQLAALDVACSRFRPDSEVSLLARAGGRPLAVSPLLFDVLTVASAVTLDTGGAVDPTVGNTMVRLGYDRDFADLPLDAPAVGGATEPAPGWWCIELDPDACTVEVPAGLVVDLGSTAKAYAADRIARIVAERTGAGVLVSLGGDVSVAGPRPVSGWPVGIALDSSVPTEAVDEVVALTSGGLASSSPLVRTWRRGGEARHHVVDPATGRCAPAYWDLASAAAPSCVAANAATTAAVVWGDSAVPRLVDMGFPVRLVRHDGEVIALNGWPEEPARAPLERAGVLS